MSKPIYGYWKIRGYGQQIRLLLEYLGVDYEEKLFDYEEKRYGLGSTKIKDGWLDQKYQLGIDFPNLPYWIEGDFNLTESKAILKYVAAVKGPALMPGNPEKQAKADQIEGVMNDLQGALVDYAYLKRKDEPLETEKFKLLEQHFDNNEWAIGDKLSYIDFFVYEVLYQFVRFKATFFQSYPALTNYIKRFEALPKMAEYQKSQAHLAVYSPWAPIPF